MAILDDMKLMLRLSSDVYDIEVEALIAAAKADMLRVGIRPAVVESNESPLVKMAIGCYCKANFGYDNDEASRFDRSYRQLVTDLLHSTDNLSLYEGEDSEIL